MAGYLVYADAPNKRRSDGFNAALVTASNEANARQACRDLAGDADHGFEDWAAVQVSSGDLATADVFLQGAGPVGAADPWPRLTRGGNTLVGA